MLLLRNSEMHEGSNIFTYSLTLIFPFFFFFNHSHPSGCEFGIRDLTFPNALLGFALVYVILVPFLSISVCLTCALSEPIAITYYKVP